MNCFSQFKERIRSRVQKSAPVLKNPSKSVAAPEPERGAKSSSSSNETRGIPELYQERAHNLRAFTLPELKQATSNFSRLLKIGEGGFGCVYKGTIKPVDGKGDATVVAVKKLNRDGHQGHKQWVTEVQFLGVVNHPNLVQLIGYCAVDGERGIQRLLVYEYMPNKSLDDHLFDRSRPGLSWEHRLRVILGAARGLAYLHEELEIQIIFRDFKSSNVLLDEDLNPKLSDFGLAREGPAAGHTHVSTGVVGTFGYAAPDYIETGHLTSKSDVWSFGVVLYEILTGRRSLEHDRPKSEQKLLDLVKLHPFNSKKFSEIMDVRLENQYSLSVARGIAKLADSCLSRSAKDRPKMSEVVEALNQMVEVSGVESPLTMTYMETAEDCDDAIAEEHAEERNDVGGVSESAKRRMEHLAKISENLGGVNRRFLVMQRAKVM